MVHLLRFDGGDSVLRYLVVLSWRTENVFSRLRCLYSVLLATSWCELPNSYERITYYLKNIYEKNQVELKSAKFNSSKIFKSSKN